METYTMLRYDDATGGPWKLSEDGRTIESITGQLIQGCAVLRMTTSVAALISAAPDLLAALEGLLAATGDGISDQKTAARVAARAAIAKARGGK